MTQEQFSNERDYCAVMALIEAMHKNGVIDSQDFALLQRKLLDQYQPVVSCLRAKEPP